MGEPYNLQLDDLVYEYPDIEEERFQTLISKKEEFRELQAPLEENEPGRNQFFKHQLLVHRFISMYDRLLLIHRTGTGKTCALGGSSEMFRRAVIESASDFISLYMIPQRTHIKKVYLILKNETLKKQFIREIACKCSRKGDYVTPDINSMKNPDDAYKAIKRKMAGPRGFYVIKSPGALAKEIYSSTMTDQQIKLKYSGSLFIIDEVHNISTDPGQDPDDITDEIAQRGSKGQEKKPRKTRDEKIKRMQKTYQTLHRLFHIVDRSKIILSTATPMINSPAEIVPVMNLILPHDMQMPSPIKTVDRTGPWKSFTFPDSEIIGAEFKNAGTYDYYKPKLEDLEKYFRGRVSYVREGDLPITAKYIGEQMKSESYNSRQILYGSTMCENEYDEYDEYTFEGQGYFYKENKSSANTKSDVARRIERHAANFVYPDGSVGGTGFRKYVNVESGRYSPNSELRPWLENIESIRKLSAKYADIIEITGSDENKDKSSFCYIPYVKGSGAVELALCFTGLKNTDGSNKYEFFRETSNVFIGDDDHNIFSEKNSEGILNTYCQQKRSEPTEEDLSLSIGGQVPGIKDPSPSGKTEREKDLSLSIGGRVPGIKDPSPSGKIEKERKLRITKRPRIALFTGDSGTQKLNENILAIFNSYENRHGEYIKVLIASPIGKEGINTANIQNIHIVSPEWNQTSIYQAISRVLRATSHLDLIYEMRRESRLSGQNDNPKIEINIYQHVALLDNEYNEDTTTVDVNIYEVVELKDMSIKRIERIMKQSSFDSKLHRNRNIRSTDKDHSPICDYDKCDYGYSDDILYDNSNETEELELGRDFFNSRGSSFSSKSPLRVSKIPVREAVTVQGTKVPRQNKKGTEDDIDYESYDVLYSDEIVESFVSDIKEIFQREFKVSLQELYDRISLKHFSRKGLDYDLEEGTPQSLYERGSRRHKFIDIALEKIISNKIVVRNRFGHNSYIREDNGIIFTQRDFPLETRWNKHGDHSVSIYGENFTAINTLPLSGYENDTFTTIEYDIIQQIDEIDRYYYERRNYNYDEIIPRIHEILKGAKIETIIELTQREIIKYVNTNSSPIIIRSLMEIYPHNIKDMEEPVNTISATLDIIAAPRTRGRKIQKTEVGDVNVEIMDEDGSGRRVYYHTFWSRVGKDSNIMSNILGVKGKIMVYIPSEGSNAWREATEVENAVYSEISRRELDEIRTQYEVDTNILVYGIILNTEGILRPINVLEYREKLEDKNFSSSQKTRPRGRKCTNTPIIDLITMMYLLEIHSRNRPITTITNRDKLVDLIPDKFRSSSKSDGGTKFSDYPTDKLQYIYSWMNISREEACMHILNKLVEKGLIWYI